MKGIPLTGVQPYHQRKVAQKTAGNHLRLILRKTNDRRTATGLVMKNCLYQERPEKTDQRFTVITWSVKVE
jgi:hypothetical protein